MAAAAHRHTSFAARRSEDPLQYRPHLSKQWHLTDPDPDPEVDTFFGKLVILQGYDGFENLHGVLDLWGRAGPGPVVSYSGRVHVDP